VATGYEVQNYRNIASIAESLKKIADALEARNVGEAAGGPSAALREAVAAADAAAEGDSNDAEIEALRDALDQALALVPGYTATGI
jgi:N-acyl-D-aspartate/D-glutamate deacylase